MDLGEFTCSGCACRYANASSFKRQTAYQCSLVLRDLLRPYMLRRLKADVELHLPSKTEKVCSDAPLTSHVHVLLTLYWAQVLFCHLTDAQRDAYEDFLEGDQAPSATFVLTS